eukprot:2377004-Karenia_brevis.AAC.1
MWLIAGGIQQEEQRMVSTSQKPPEKTVAMLPDYGSSTCGVHTKEYFIVGQILGVSQFGFVKTRGIACSPKSFHVGGFALQ